MVRFIWFFYFTIHYLTHTLIPPSLYPVLHPWQLHLPYSPDLGRVRARRTTFLDRFLAQLPHLLLGRPRLAIIWLILDLARTRWPDSENQNILDNGLWWRYLGIEWKYPLGSFSSLVPTVCHRLPSFTFYPCSTCTYLAFFWSMSPFYPLFLPHHRTSYLALSLFTLPLHNIFIRFPPLFPFTRN